MCLITLERASYDALKKLFPSTPLDPSYHSTPQTRESSSILPLHNAPASDKYASPEQFRQALDRERYKVADFYKTKIDDLQRAFERMEDEVATLEDRDLGTDDIIKEEDEDEDEVDDEDGERRGEGDALISPQISAAPPRPVVKARLSVFGRLAPAFGRNGRRKSAIPSSHEADIIEASMGNVRRVRSRSTSNGMDQSISSGIPFDERGVAPSKGRMSGPTRGRRSSDMGSSEDGVGRDRRTSISSTSSHEREVAWPRRRYHSIGLVQMDPTAVPNGVVHPPPEEDGVHVETQGEEARPVLIWTANNDYGTVLRIGFKKRISAVWLEAYALKQYVELNLTAFEKILKK